MDDDNTPALDAPSPEPEKINPVPVYTDETRPANPPDHMVVGDNFVAQTEQGEFVTSLRIPERTMEAISGIPVRDQFMILLSDRGQSDWLEKIGELDSIDAKILRAKFTQAHYEREQARLGESFGSSDS